MSLRHYLQGRVVIATGDITTFAVDAIVNAANSSLLGGGGVDGAIHRKGGPEILAQCRELRRTTYPDGLPPGEVAITTGGRLPARFVIHTVGPVWGQHDHAVELLGACYRRAIALADLRALHEIAFPAISTGAYGFPREEAARVASLAIMDALQKARAVSRIHLVFYAPADANVFLQYQQFEPVTPDFAGAPFGEPRR